MKTLLLNGSPREKGNTFQALRMVASSLEEEGIETEILQIPKEPVSGCIECYACRSNGNGRCGVNGYVVNTVIEKIANADALVLGSPVFYAAPNGQLLAVLDRAFFAGSGAGIFAGKPAAAICAVRRGGASAALDVLQKYFNINGMPIAPSNYWSIIHGRDPGEVEHDKEGVQTMQMLGKTIAWMLKCFKAGKENGIQYPDVPGGKKIATNFIR